MLEEKQKNKQSRELDPKVLQLNLTGFLKARPAREFMADLWRLLVRLIHTAGVF